MTKCVNSGTALKIFLRQICRRFFYYIARYPQSVHVQDFLSKMVSAEGNGVRLNIKKNQFSRMTTSLDTVILQNLILCVLCTNLYFHVEHIKKLGLNLLSIDIIIA